jgi:hypothetical protein
MRNKMMFVLLVIIWLLSAVSHAVDPLTVAATGITTSLLLDKLDDKATHIVQNAAAAGSLLTSKAARDFQLEIEAARQQLHDELNQQWDRLDQEKVSGLRAIDSALDQLNQTAMQAGKIEDDLALDVDQTLNKIPFLAKTATIRRIWGASQYYKPQGIYIISLHGNVFDQSAGVPDVWIDSKQLTTRPNLKPPYDVVINIPVNLINDKFQDRKLTYLPIVIKQQVPNRAYGFQVWRSQYRPTEFKFMLELFPKYPAAYRLTEFDEEPIVDSTQTLTQARREMLIPGCGDSGCNAYWNVCEDVPPGAQPVAAVDYYDSFNGWGGFDGDHPTFTSTGICVKYWQHSHNVARNVGFAVQYHPLSSHVVDHDVELVPLSSDSLSDYFRDDDAKDTRIAKDTTVTGATNPTAPVGHGGFWDIVGILATMRSGSGAVARSGVDHGAVRLGRSYDARFSSNMKSFTLVFRTFTGEELIATPAKTANMLDISPLENQTNFKRMTVAIKPPW